MLSTDMQDLGDFDICLVCEYWRGINLSAGVSGLAQVSWALSRLAGAEARRTPALQELTRRRQNGKAGHRSHLSL